MYMNKPLLEFYCVYVSKEEFPNLRASALKWSSVFRSTYLCQPFFSKMDITKSCYRSRLTDENLSMLRVAKSSVRLNIKRLVKQKSFQFSTEQKILLNVSLLFFIISCFNIALNNISCMVRMGFYYFHLLFVLLMNNFVCFNRFHSMIKGPFPLRA